jgi:hypothetical protein
VCTEDLRLPLIGKKAVSTMNWKLVSSTVKGDGEMAFAPTQSDLRAEGQKDLVLIFRMYQDTNFNFPAGISFAGAPTYRTELDRVVLKCDQNTVVTVQSEYYDATNKLVVLTVPDPSKVVAQQYVEQSPYSVLRRMVCGSTGAR